MLFSHAFAYHAHKMPPSLFPSEETYKVQTGLKSSIHPDLHATAIDEGYYSFDDSNYTDVESDYDEEVCLATSNNYDHDRNKSFKYGQIDENSQVRLFRITKVTKETVEGHFKVVDVADLAKVDKIRYLALSYTWGRAKTDDDIHPVNIGTQTFYVRTNLWDFFASTKDRYALSYLYIDAICTDQKNMDERRHQVKLMADIYANAERVLVWLGKPLLHQRDNLKALHKQLSNLSPGQYSRDVIRGLAHVCSSRYWTRLWVVQELLLAKDIEVHFGEWRFEWDDIADLQRVPLDDADLIYHKKLDWRQVWIDPLVPEDGIAERIPEGWEYALRIFDHRSKWKRRMNVRRASNPGELVRVRDCGLPLHKAIYYFSKQRCQDPLDKVYAVVGLLTDKEKDKIVPSYRKRPEEVYAEALTVCAVSLQNDIEHEAIQKGYYPEDAYTDYARYLQRILGLLSQDLGEMTMGAFRNEEFHKNFVSNLKDQLELAWPSDDASGDIEKNILHAFLMLTEGKNSLRKEVRLRVEVRGKRHFTSAVLTAARPHFRRQKVLLEPNEKQNFSFTVVSSGAKTWQRVQFRRRRPLGGRSRYFRRI